MPLDDDYKNLSEDIPSRNLKKVSSQKSIFDGIPRKPTQNDLDQQVKQMQEKNADYKQRTAELAIQFRKLMEDKTLPQNKNVFAAEMEKDILSKIIQLASEINNDPHEDEGMGSLSWIAQLFKTCLAQRDRMNKFEFAILQLEKKLDPQNLSNLVSKEISLSLDKKKVSE